MIHLKQTWLGKKAKLYWTSYKNNPDILDRLERKLFAAQYRLPPLPAPTERETGLINDLRARMAQLPLIIPDANTPGPERMWTGYKNELREKVLTDDPRDFLSWHVVAMTMGGSLRRRDYLTLAKTPFWSDWKQKLAARPLIHQMPYFKLPHVDGTTLAHTYHLAQFRLRTGVEPHQFKRIIDFGGGYGSMCATAHALGFSGEYILFDWPEFLLLQEFYLKLRGLDTSRVRFISALEELQGLAECDASLLVATWSISETSEAFRNEFFARINPAYYIIGYQRRVAEVDNHRYFRQFVLDRPSITWQDFPIPNLPGEGNRYLMGTPRNAAT